MSTLISYEKKLCMSQLNVTHSSTANQFFFDISEGRTNAGFIYVVKGEVVVRSGNEQHKFSKGSLFYLPGGIRYTARWSGKEGIEYYGLYSVSKHYDTIAPDEFSLQEITPPWKNPSDNVIIKIFSLMESGQRINKVRAIGLYYSFYADMLSVMQQSNIKQLNSALVRAINLIDDKFSENIPISYIAQQCYISESRLYHLFQNELQVTPTAYRNERRIFHSTELLTNTNDSIEQIAFNVGFQSVTHFREVFRRFTGLSPAKYRSNFMQNKINVIKSNNN